MIRNKFVPKQIIIFLTFLFFILCGFLLQTTFWFNLFGYFPAPCLWLPIFVYLMMNRTFPTHYLWFACFYLLLLTCTVALPISLFLALSSTFFLIHFIQHRFSTLSIFDIMLFSSGSIILFPIIYAFFNLFFLGQFNLDILSLIISFVLSLPLIPGILMLCKKTDTLLNPHNDDSLVLHL